MNRRRFLELFAGAGVAKAATHFLPPIAGWHQSRVQTFTLSLPKTSILTIAGNVYAFDLQMQRMAPRPATFIIPVRFSVPLRFAGALTLNQTQQ